MSSTIRRLRPEEISVVGPLLLETNAGVFIGELENDLRKSQARWPSLQLVAEVDGVLAGLAAGRLDEKEPTRGWSDDLAVVAAYRGRGLGDALIEAQLDEFRALGCVRVCGLSPESLAKQVTFFQRHGFRVVGEERAQRLWGVQEGERVFLTEAILQPRAEMIARVDARALK